MNAPREYYPVGYDKNFDDNFASRVDLPDTSFYCGDQKHFPGLYADEDLGCMVRLSKLYYIKVIKKVKNKIFILLIFYDIYFCCFEKILEINFCAIRYSTFAH